MNTEALNFLGVAPGSGFNGFSTGIGEDTEGDGDGIALVFIALEAEGHFVLAEALMGDFDAVIILFALEENGGGGGEFVEIIRGGFSIFMAGQAPQALEDLTGSDSGGAERNGAASSGDGMGGELGEFFGFDEALAGVEPLLVAGLAPVGKIMVVDGRAFELGGEDVPDAGKFVEPREDV
jgi:hypothetical protein